MKSVVMGRCFLKCDREGSIFYFYTSMWVLCGGIFKVLYVLLV